MNTGSLYYQVIFYHFNFGLAVGEFIWSDLKTLISKNETQWPANVKPTKRNVKATASVVRSSKVSIGKTL